MGPSRARRGAHAAGAATLEAAWPQWEAAQAAAFPAWAASGSARLLDDLRAVAALGAEGAT